jgi:uncharacterized protein YnzC (UPF0291/DUF896 family)
MALTKEFTKTVSFSCTFEELKKAIEESINVLGLKNKEKSVTDQEMVHKTSERLNFLSTNWPVHYDVESKKIDNGWRVIVKCWAKMTSITQDRHTEKKPQEFIELIKDYGNLKTLKEADESSDNNISKLEKLAELKGKGVITEEEFQEKKEILLSDI